MLNETEVKQLNVLVESYAKRNNKVYSQFVGARNLIDWSISLASKASLVTLMLAFHGVVWDNIKEQPFGTISNYKQVALVFMLSVSYVLITMGIYALIRGSLGLLVYTYLHFADILSSRVYTETLKVRWIVDCGNYYQVYFSKGHQLFSIKTTDFYMVGDKVNVRLREVVLTGNTVYKAISLKGLVEHTTSVEEVNVYNYIMA